MNGFHPSTAIKNGAVLFARESTVDSKITESILSLSQPHCRDRHLSDTAVPKEKKRFAKGRIPY